MSEEELLKDYMTNNSILIIDSVSSARVTLASNLARMGGQRYKMALVGSLQEAREEIKKNKPKIIFSDFMIGQESGLDLIQEQKASRNQAEKDDTLFVLVTGNASQSTVARAAEEDVDTFIIKPYTMNSLLSALKDAVQLKLRPSFYLQLIEEGKKLLFSGKPDESIVVFEKAMKENAKPTLALFYLGQAEFMKSALDVAKDKYAEGLGYNKIHYKCLVGLFDLLNSQKKYRDAYDVIRTLAQFFPANPKRLGSVLRLAIMTENYGDMEGYYRIYVKLPEHSDELIKYMCSALLVTAKYYLRNSHRTRALEIFKNAAISAGGRSHFLIYIVETLVEYKMKNEANEYLKRIIQMAPGSNDVWAAQFLVSTLSNDRIASIQLGRDAIRRGISIPSVYEKLILQSVRGGYCDEAQELFETACKKWPDKIDSFNFALVSEKEAFSDPSDQTATGMTN
jgi:CheY-like chemotaxis protein